jgi:hypothetical protein
VHAGHALKPAHILGGVSQVQDALHAEGNSRQPARVHIPVDEPVVIVFRVVRIVRRLQVCAVERDPELLVPEYLGKGLVHTGMLAVVP